MGGVFFFEKILINFTLKDVRMNILKIMTPLAKLLPFTKPESKPLHAGEIYHLWEALTGGYKIISILETYLMNTEDAELHLFLRSLITSTNINRIKTFENILKEEGFSVPPQPGTKRHQGKPGVGQEVKLSDD